MKQAVVLMQIRQATYGDGTPVVGWKRWICVEHPDDGGPLPAADVSAAITEHLTKYHHRKERTPCTRR